MHDLINRREYLFRASQGCLASAAGMVIAASAQPLAAEAATPQLYPANLKISLNAYSFSKMLNDYNKDQSTGVSLFQLLEFCGQNGFEGIDPTGYFFPGYPKVPADVYVNNFKRRAFNLGIGISGTGVRNNLTTADKAIRAAGVEHIKQWVEVAARLGAPVLRVFADTQMKSQTWQSVAPGCTRDQVEAWIADDIRECAEHGKKFGVIIGVQNHGDFLKTSGEHLSLIRRVGSEWCGPIVDTGYYKTDDPYRDIAAVAAVAVNWQIKESPIAAGSDVRTDLKKIMTIVRQSGYRGYLPIETLSASGKDYDPFRVVPPFLAELREAMQATASISSPPPQPAANSLAQPVILNSEAASSPNIRPARKPPNKNRATPSTNP
jgi:sugar phosphate isomerase/epimerase